MTLRIGWFSTGAGSGSQRYRVFRAAAAAMRAGAIDAEIAFVFCSRERGEDAGTDEFLDAVAAYGIPAVTLSSRRFRKERGGERSRPGEPLPAWRAEYDRAVASRIEPFAFDLGVLMGYMLIFTAEMSLRHPFLNLHPAEPGGPAGTWQHVIWQLIDARAGRSGVMVHLATEELDRGPPVTFCTFSLRGPAFDPPWEDLGARMSADLQAGEGEEHPLFREIRRHGAARELPLVIETLHALGAGRLRIEGRVVVDAAGRKLEGGLDLTPEIDAAVAAELSV